jgi:predicted nucleotide-binding protein
VVALKVNRQEAAHVLSAHGEEGNTLLALATELPNEPAFQGWRRNRTRWIKRTEDALKHIYADDGAAKEFLDSAYPKVALRGASQWQLNLGFDCEYVQDAINTLISLSERLQYADEPALPPAVTQPAVMQPEKDEPVIFLVHGHDHNTRDKVRAFLDRASAHQYEIVILDEQASKGDTVVEKLETHASASQYAVVLLTGDDEGGPKGKPGQFRPRARQNVILELGWFQGRLGRKKVAVLRDDDVEQPSDIAGLVYISLASEWERLLARELKAAGFDVILDRD